MSPYFYLTNIIAKALAFVDGLLAQWVDTGAAFNYNNNNCYNFDLINVELNTCGKNLVTDLAVVVNGIVALVPTILAGLFAIGPKLG
jgi:hypothetical protein